jgi:SHS2 domain-containing protein
MAPYRYIEHTADVAILATGATVEEMFAAAGEALAGFLCELEGVKERDERSVDASAPDLDALLVDWLSEINYMFEVERFAFRRFEVREAGGGSVRAVGFGEPLDPSRHTVGEQVKAVTYHGLKIEQGPPGYSAQVVMDI